MHKIANAEENVEKQAKITNSTYHPGGKKNTQRETEPAELQPPVRNTSSSPASSFSFIFRAHCLAPWLLDAFVIYTLECFSFLFWLHTYYTHLQAHRIITHRLFYFNMPTFTKQPFIRLLTKGTARNENPNGKVRRKIFKKPTDFSLYGAIKRSVLI